MLNYWNNYDQPLLNCFYSITSPTSSLQVIPVIQQRPQRCTGSLYETFEPDVAKALWDRFEFVYTPKHGSWLNMAEIELNVLIKQCLDRRIDNLDQIQAEVGAWQKRRNNAKSLCANIGETPD